MDTTANKEALLYAEFEKALKVKNYQIDGIIKARKMAGNSDGLTNFENALEQRGFHVRNILGKGAFGEVVQAECRDDGKLYALKIIPLVNGESTKYHRRELELLVTTLELSKQNVIKYFKSWIIKDGDVQRLCIRMELCSVNLEKFIYENDKGGVEIIKAESPRLYQHVFPQILNGLSVIHSIHWVHRDIHPGNILIANPYPRRINDIHVKIADFGLARHISKEFEKSVGLTVVPTLEKLSPVVGDELFRAPEISTERYDFKVDVYSSGIVLYLLDRCLANKTQLRSEILALRKDGSGLENLYHKNDEKLVQLIIWLLQKESKNRPTAAEALQYIQPENCGSETKKFLAKKHGDDTCYRCSSSDTLSSMQEAIQEHPCIGIVKDNQILKQVKIIENEKMLVGITSDRDVCEMFQSAEKQGKEVIVVVSEPEPEDDNVAL